MSTGLSERVGRWAVRRSILKGTIHVPPSKSQTLRAILLAGMADGVSHIYNPLRSPDSQAMINAVQQLGARVNDQGDCLLITGNGGRISTVQQPIDAGNSGLVLRMVSAMASLAGSPVVLTGDASVRKRPMKDLLSGLRQLGVEAVALEHNNLAPVQIRGPLCCVGSALSCQLEGHDSQPVSSMLLLAAVSGLPLQIKVTKPGEKPWIDVTLAWLKRLGVTVERDGYEHYTVRRTAPLSSFTYTVPGDISSAAFPVVAAITTGSQLSVTGLDLLDGQPDVRLLEGLRQMGAAISESEDGTTLTVDGQSPLKGCDLDINDCIDTIVAFAVAGCFAQGRTRIHNAAVAREKECDRIAMLREELSKMGARVQEFEDGLSIEADSLKGARVLSHGDHRMAMGLTVAALGASTPSEVIETECAAKTYPDFVRSMQAIGASIEDQES